MRFLNGRVMGDVTLIEREEREFGIEFPCLYREIVTEHDGASIEPAGVRFISPQTGLEEVIECNSLIPFVANDTGSPTMAETNRGLIQNLPFGLIVFGREAGGYLFGFDYSNQTEGADVPIVLLHLDNDPEFAVIEVADSFDQFIAGLEPYQEPDHRPLD